MSTPTASEILAGIENLFKLGGHETWNGQLPHAKELFEQGLQLDSLDGLTFHPTFLKLRDELDLVDRPNTETDEKMLQALGLAGAAECLPLDAAEQKRQAADKRITACADLIRNMKEQESPVIDVSADELKVQNKIVSKGLADVIDVTPFDAEGEAFDVAFSDYRCKRKQVGGEQAFDEAFDRYQTERRQQKAAVDVVTTEPEPGLIDMAEAERMLALLGVDRVITCAYGSTNLFTPRRSGDRYDWEKVPTAVDWKAVQRDLKQNGTKNLGFISCPGGTRVVDRTGKPGEIFECSLLVYEIDKLPKDQQWGLWEKVGFEPTLVMDTGNDSLHVWVKLAKPLTPKQGKDARKRLSLAIEKHLPKGFTTDQMMHSTHQPARLAGGIHPKTGNRSTIVLATGKIHDNDALLALLPELPIDTKTTNATGCIWREDPADSKTANFNWDAKAHHLQGVTVPLEVALGETTIQDIENGVAAGSGRRAARAWSIAKTVQCADAQLNELGVPFTGTACELFERFVVNSGIDVDYCHGDVDGAFDRYWESDDIGEGDLSRVALVGRLEAIDWEHWVKNPAPGGWIFKGREKAQEWLKARKREKARAKIQKAAELRHKSRHIKSLDFRMDVFERYVKALSYSIRNSLRRTAKLRQAQEDLKLKSVLKPADITRLVMESLDDQTGNAYQPLDAAARAAMPKPKVEWILEDLIPANDVTIIGGRPKVGKTRFAVGLMRSILNGVGFMEYKASGPTRKVIFVSDDQSDGDTASMLEAAKIWDHPGLIWSRRFRMTERNLDGLLKTIEANPGAVVVMDSLRSITRSTGIDENSPEIGPLLYDLKTAVTDAGGTLMLVHHCNKSNDTIGTEALSGHNSIPSAANTVITLHYTAETILQHAMSKTTLDRRMVREARSGNGADIVTNGGGDDATYISLGDYAAYSQSQESEALADQMQQLLNGNEDLEKSLRVLLRVYRNPMAAPGVSLLMLMQEIKLVKQGVTKVKDLDSDEKGTYRSLKGWFDKNCEQPGKFIKRKKDQAAQALLVSIKSKSSSEGQGAVMYALTEHGASTLEELFKQRD